MDDIYTKEFLEELYRKISDIDSGKEKTYPLDDVLEIWSEDAQKYYDEQ